MFESVLDSTNTLSFEGVLLCSIVSVILGLIISIVHMFTSKYSKNFVVTLAVLPFLVSTVIMMVNGNLGTSVAVLGAFSLIRFRSIPGNSKEICAVFLAMTVGLATGMGQLLFASFLTLFICAIIILLGKTNFGIRKVSQKKLKIVVPEDLKFNNMFDDLFSKYTKVNILEKIKTTNLGSLYELTYKVELYDSNKAKEFIDDLRCRNGNLNIILSDVDDNNNDL